MFDSPRDFLNKIWLGWTIYLLALWERFCTTRSLDDDREILLRKSGIASADDDSTLRQTVAGGLILSFIN